MPRVTNNAGAFLYVAANAVLCMGLAVACTPGDRITTPDKSLPTSAVFIQIKPHVGKLSPGERLKAIATRSRIARNGAAPRETIQRRYDGDGRVISEATKQGSSWVERPSTMPAALMSRPLQSFLSNPHEAALMYGDSVLSGTHSHSIHDIVTDTTAVATDTLQVNVTAGTVFLTRDSDDPHAAMAADAYYSDPAQAPKVTGTTSGAMFVIQPGTVDEVVEWDAAGSDWGTGVSGFIADTVGSGGGSLRVQESAPPIFAGPSQAFAESTVVTTHSGGLVDSPLGSFANMQSNCNGYLYAAMIDQVILTLLTVAIIVTGIFEMWPVVTGLIALAATVEISSVTNVAKWIACKLGIPI